MKNLLRFLLPTLLLAAVWQSCWKDDAPPFFEPTAEVSFTGQVTDDQGQPVADAAVRAGSAFAKTDENGIFTLKAVRLPARDAQLSVFKIGYFDFTRNYPVSDGAKKIVNIQLLPRQLTATLNTAQGGTVQVPGGVGLDFPAGSVARADGSTFNGPVNVYARYIDPTSENWFRQMPGDLRAINTEGRQLGLVTYGMVVVELENNAGEALQVAPGHTVELRMPVQPEQMGDAPSSIPLWWFDTDRSRWIEEGSAQLVGNEYVGQVSHFTWWNCDFQGERVFVNGQVFIGDTDHPLSGVAVWICPQGSALTVGCGHGETDLQGNFAGGVPVGVPLELTVVLYSPNCTNNVLYTQNIGPLTADAVLPPVIIPANSIQTFNVSGQIVDCSQQPVTNGYAKIVCNGATAYAYTDAQGNFLYAYPCVLSPANFTITGYNLNLNLQSTPAVFNNASSPLAAGALEACNNLTEYIQYTLDGENFLEIDPNASYFAPSTNVYGPSTNIYFGFANNAQTGTFPMSYFYASQDTTTSTTVTTTLTQFGNTGEPIIGTFDGSFLDAGGASHTVSGSYRVIRD
ncbi:MAG: carboxypeptidase-like regulatory domain-containing protein [Saprospiraceae bacterium]|nr:carboxypeptidase-like regulatory domain-containing protein [Saprospiraceae bacterium]